jgi:ribosomal protein S21
MDDEAYRARVKAEETFDNAERQLSTSLAREGCRQAIQSWDLYEKAIRKATELLRRK